MLYFCKGGKLNIALKGKLLENRLNFLGKCLPGLISEQLPQTFIFTKSAKINLWKIYHTKAVNLGHELKTYQHKIKSCELFIIFKQLNGIICSPLYFINSAFMFRHKPLTIYKIRIDRKPSLHETLNCKIAKREKNENYRFWLIGYKNSQN